MTIRSGAKRGVVGLCGLMLVAAGAGCAGSKPYRSEAVETLQFDVAGQQKLSLTGRVGEIRISGDAGATSVTAEVHKRGRGTSPREADKALGEIEVSLGARSGDSAVIEARSQHPYSKWTRDYEVDWTVTVPARFSVAVRSTIGDGTLTGMDGDVTIDSSVGDVGVSHAHGAVRIESQVGDVRVSEVDGAVRVISGVGDVHAQSVRGPAEVRTGTGDAHVRGVAGGIEVRTGTGDVRVEVAKVGTENISARSGTGSIHVTLPRDVRGRLSAQTNTGGVTLRLGETPMTDARLTTKSVECTLNGEDTPSLYVASGVGNCTVRVQ